jgi:glutaminyl-peptide cyclotransferase
VRSAGVGRREKLQPSKKKSNVRSAAGAFWFLSLFFTASSCKPGDTATPVDSQKTQADPNQANNPVPSGTPLRREKIWADFDGRQALAEAKTLTDFGPRPSGSDANKQIRQHLIDRLTGLGWQTSEQRLTEQAPDGREIEFCNLIARFSRYAASVQKIVIGAHFDTPPTQEFRDPGASDGAANTAVLIELSRVLALDPQLAGEVELLFLDGDAPFRELSLNDGLFGSRFYTQMLRMNRHAGDVRAAILLDNVGGPTLNYLPNGDPNLTGVLKKAATVLGVKLDPANRSLLADHMPFAQAGIPSITLLNADSPFLNTADDTADRLDEDSLAKTGNLILYFIATEGGNQ